MIGANELIALDTDVVGVHGHYADFSRSFLAGPAAPIATQRAPYRLAHDQVHHNIGVIRPGMSFGDDANAAWDIPDKDHANRYYLSAHGCGMTGEYPYLYHHGDLPQAGHDGEIVPAWCSASKASSARTAGRRG